MIVRCFPYLYAPVGYGDATTKREKMCETVPHKVLIFNWALQLGPSIVHDQLPRSTLLI
jgi:hypothetical protein